MPLQKSELEILTAIRENSNFRTEFAKSAQSIVDKIYSFYQNPNCTCKKAIIDWIQKNETVVNEVVSKVPDAFKEKSNVEINNTVPDKRTPVHQKMIAGTVVEIPNKEEAFKELIISKQRNREMYRGISVLEKDNKWVIFFY